MNVFEHGEKPIKGLEDHYRAQDRFAAPHTILMNFLIYCGASLIAWPFFLYSVYYHYLPWPGTKWKRTF